MATLKVRIPENTQNIEGVVTIRAPLAKVFGAHKDPKLFAQWWCRGNPMQVFRFDCRDGGVWHIAEVIPERGHVRPERAEAGWRQSIEALGKLLEK